MQQSGRFIQCRFSVIATNDFLRQRGTAGRARVALVSIFPVVLFLVSGQGFVACASCKTSRSDELRWCTRDEQPSNAVAFSSRYLKARRSLSRIGDQAGKSDPFSSGAAAPSRELVSSKFFYCLRPGYSCPASRWQFLHRAAGHPRAPSRLSG
jgi:hypothetical protein